MPFHNELNPDCEVPEYWLTKDVCQHLALQEGVTWSYQIRNYTLPADSGDLLSSLFTSSSFREWQKEQRLVRGDPMVTAALRQLRYVHTAHKKCRQRTRPARKLLRAAALARKIKSAGAKATAKAKGGGKARGRGRGRGKGKGVGGDADDTPSVDADGGDGGDGSGAAAADVDAGDSAAAAVVCDESDDDGSHDSDESSVSATTPALGVHHADISPSVREPILDSTGRYMGSLGMLGGCGEPTWGVYCKHCKYTTLVQDRRTPNPALLIQWVQLVEHTTMTKDEHLSMFYDYTGCTPPKGKGKGKSTSSSSAGPG